MGLKPGFVVYFNGRAGSTKTSTRQRDSPLHRHHPAQRPAFWYPRVAKIRPQYVAKQDGKISTFWVPTLPRAERFRGSNGASRPATLPAISGPGFLRHLHGDSADIWLCDLLQPAENAILPDSLATPRGDWNGAFSGPCPSCESTGPRKGPE